MTNQENNQNPIEEPKAQPETAATPEEESGAIQETKKIIESSSDDTTSYVIPPKRKKHHHHRHHHHHHSHHSSHHHSTRRIGDEDEPYDGYVFKKKRRRKRRHMRRGVKILLIVLAALLALILATATTVIILREVGKNQMHDYEDVNIVIEDDADKSSDDQKNLADQVEILNNGKAIIYNGTKYLLNEDVASVVFIGVDQNIAENEQAMSDAIYILALDDKTKKTTVIGVSRDTMTDINVYSAEGNFIDTEKMQLAYAYSFGSDKEQGAENTTSALSKLFFGLPFKNYFAIDMAALIQLNDQIGGVTLTSSMTFTSPLDGRTISEGEKVTLYGKEADTYVRTRDTSKLDSNNARMKRQREYIQAFLKNAVPAVRQDLTTITTLYNTIRVNSVTSLSLAKMTYLAGEAVSLISNPADVEFKNVKGTIKKGEYAELYPDDQEVLELMLDVFYLPESGSD